MEWPRLLDFDAGPATWPYGVNLKQCSVSPSPEPFSIGQNQDQAAAHISVVNEFPEDLYNAMREFVHSHPQWDHYRLMQASVAGFLFQNGSTDRAVSRHYLNGLFQRELAKPRSAAAHPATPIKATPPNLLSVSQQPEPDQESSWPTAA